MFSTVPRPASIQSVLTPRSRGTSTRAFRLKFLLAVRNESRQSGSRRVSISTREIFAFASCSTWKLTTLYSKVSGSMRPSVSTARHKSTRSIRNGTRRFLVISIRESFLPSSLPRINSRSGDSRSSSFAFDNELELAEIVAGERDIAVPDVHEPRIVKDDAIIDQESPLSADPRSKNAHAMFVIDEWRLDCQTSGGWRLFIERQHNFEPFAFVNAQ